MAPAQIRLRPVDITARLNRYPGALAFVSVIGFAIDQCRSLQVYRALVAIGVAPNMAWSVIDNWAHWEGTEMLDGWSPESITGALLLDSCPDLRAVPWALFFAQAVGQKTTRGDER